ncbi:Holliday junction resolvase RuvX [Proteobacteria bacterium 005FR1]|nr:Holliday junction resolvase RuvX [Proteobacteria bacterium 005FR1]
MPDTILAFDYGTQNIGAAVGQTLTRTADELTPLKAKDGIPSWDIIAKLLSEWKPDLLLVGLPLNMDGSESELAVRARKFGNRLHGRFGLRVEMVDERLSTFTAKGEAMERGHRRNYGEKPVDSIAARLILESWFERER